METGKRRAFCRCQQQDEWMDGNKIDKVLHSKKKKQNVNLEHTICLVTRERRRDKEEHTNSILSIVCNYYMYILDRIT